MNDESAWDRLNKPKPMTDKQADRQLHRTRRTGKYAKVNPCELCGKSTDHDNYYTIDWCNEAPFNGRGLVLHAKCCAKLEAMGKDAAAKALGCAT